MNIRGLNHSCSQNVIKTQYPNCLWDHCADLEACIRFFTAHENSLLDGEVPESIMKGYTLGISIICEYYWYEWVIYNDTTL